MVIGSLVNVAMEQGAYYATNTHQIDIFNNIFRQ